MIASHLQKYRQRIIKDFGLQNMTEIQNYQFPLLLQNPILTDLSQRWSDIINFSGLSEEEIVSLVNQL